MSEQFCITLTTTNNDEIKQKIIDLILKKDWRPAFRPCQSIAIIFGRVKCAVTTKVC